MSQRNSLTAATRLLQLALHQRRELFLEHRRFLLCREDALCGLRLGLQLGQPASLHTPPDRVARVVVGGLAARRVTTAGASVACSATCALNRSIVPEAAS